MISSTLIDHLPDVSKRRERSCSQSASARTLTDRRLVAATADRCLSGLFVMKELYHA
jgi:hypothetical protein